jgi:DNA (cytosine-5)-methyltransferase 1
MALQKKRSANKDAAEESVAKKVVLVGTYKGDMLTKWRDWYCYPVRASDKISEADAAKINTLWLFKGAAEQKNYKAEFVGVKTRAELVRDYGYPAEGKAHGEKYLLFRKTALYRIQDTPPEEAERVFVRTADFARSPKVRKQLKAYLESPDRADPDLAKLLPSIVTKVPREALRVCEAAVQLELWSPPEMRLILPPVPFPPPAHPKFTFIDLFAGIGGFRLAMQSCGGKCVFSSEWDAKAQETYRTNFGDQPYGDITKKETREAIPDQFDVLCGGFPCQPFSSIGKRQGFEHPTQGTLFFHIQSILGEKKPKAFILENVPGLVTHKDGETLQTIKDVLRDELGYTMDYKVLNSADFGVPQYRKRLYLIGFRQDLPVYVRGEDAQHGGAVSSDGRDATGNVVFEFPKGKFAKNHQGFGQFVERDATGPSISAYLQKSYIFKADDGHPEVVDENFDRPVKTLCASYHKIQRLTGTFVRGGPTGLRLLTESECKHIMGFPQTYKVPVSRTSMYHQFGNSVAVPVIDELAKTLLATLAKTEK